MVWRLTSEQPPRQQYHRSSRWELAMSAPGVLRVRLTGPTLRYDEFRRFTERLSAEHIDEIAAVPGVDILYIGTSDLSYSLGHGGQYNHPASLAAIKKIVAAAQRNKVPLGRPGRTPEQMKEYLEQGFTVFQSPSDVSLMLRGGRAFLDPFGKAGIDPAKRPLY